MRYITLANKSFKLISTVAITLLCFFICACEDRSYENERLALLGQAKQILIDEKVCDSVIDCQKKQNLFSGPINSGISVQIFGIKDPEVLSRLSQIYEKRFFQLNGKMKIEMRIHFMDWDSYSNAPFWKKAGSDMQISLEEP